MVKQGPRASGEVPIKVIAKVGLILSAFRQEGPELRLQQIAQSAQLEVSTASRLVSSLVQVGLMRYDSVQRLYSPGLIMLELSRAVLNRFSFRELAHREMIALSSETGWQCYLAVVDEDDERHLIYIDAVSSRSAEISEIGQRRPMHSTATGKVLLAFRQIPVRDWQMAPRTPHTHTDAAGLEAELAQVRKQGYALSVDEEEMDTCSVAAPIFDAVGQVIAAFGVSTTDSDFATGPDRHIEVVTAKARGITSAARLSDTNSA